VLHGGEWRHPLTFMPLTDRSDITALGSPETSESHLSYLPHSGSVLPALCDRTDGYSQTKSALHFPPDRPLPCHLVRDLIDTKFTESGRR
jgi:hypothetical protein